MENKNSMIFVLSNDRHFNEVWKVQTYAIVIGSQNTNHWASAQPESLCRTKLIQQVVYFLK